MPDNPIDSAFATAPNTDQSSQSANPIDSAFSTSQPRSNSSFGSSSNPIDAAFGRSSPVTPSEPTTNVRKMNEEPQSWLGRAWDWTNTPVINYFGAPEMPESLQGPGFLSGVGRGLYRVAAGFTSPLSIAFLVGTAGIGGLLESVGGNALKEAGLSVVEIADVAKGAKVNPTSYPID